MFGVPTPLKQPKIKKQQWNIKITPDVEKAKRVSIESLYTGSLKTTGKTKMGKCPFHQEKTPSFAIYPATNTWNCFAGCGGGDVISFYMKLHDVDFGVAVAELAK